MAVAMRVDGTLDDLQSEYKKNPKCVNDQSWQTRLLDALYERDDLEGVRMILTRAGVTPENDNQRFDFGVAFDFFNDLDLMDHLGNELIQELPPLSILRNNERLRRAHNLDHLAWWAKPAGHPSETAENN
jgi:hypothetical protein